MSTNHKFWRERRADADSKRGSSAYEPNALPLGQTGSPILSKVSKHFALRPQKQDDLSKVKVSMLLYVHRTRWLCLPLLLPLYGDGMKTSSRAPHRFLGRATVQASLSGTLLPNSARTGYVIEGAQLISVRLFSAPPPAPQVSRCRCSPWRIVKSLSKKDVHTHSTIMVVLRSHVDSNHRGFQAHT